MPHKTRATIETLEPRALLAAYDAQSLAEYFHLPDTIYNLTPPQSGEFANFGAAATGLGDINGDGKADFAISATGTVDANGVTGNPGAVFVYSGATGQTIRTVSDGFAEFGVSLANMGDVNGDTIPDMLVGSPIFDNGTTGSLGPLGAAYVYSGADGTLLRTYVGQRPSGEFGTTVAAAGLADNDNISDAMVGAPNDGGTNQGRVYTLKGADVPPVQQIIRFFTGEVQGDRFGAAIAPADLQTPQQGVNPSPDYLIGAPNNGAGGTNTGRAYIYRQSDGLLALTLTGTALGGNFGSAVLTIKNSTQAIILVGAPGEAQSDAQRRGAVHVYTTSGAEIGSGLVGSTVGGLFGSAITAVGDINDDGVGDVGISSPAAPANTQAVFFYSAVNAAAIATPLSTISKVGSLAVAAGDVNGDGQPDVIGLSPTPGVASVLSSFALVPPNGVTGSSDDLTFIFYRNWAAETTTPTYRTAYAFVNNVYKKYSDIPGLFDSDAVFGVNDHSLIAGAVVVPSAVPLIPPSLGDRFIVQNGVRTLLQNAVTRIEGGEVPTYGSFTLVKVGNDGSILYTDDGSGQRSWLFKDGVLTFLWRGNVTDVNSSGLIVGNPLVNGLSVTPVRRSTNGATISLTGLTTASSIDDSNIVYGANFNNNAILQPVKWSNGTVTVLAPTSVLGSRNFLTMTVDANNNGLALVNATYLAGSGTLGISAIFTPTDGLQLLSDVVFGGGSSTPIALSTNGTIITIGGLDVVVNPQDPWTLAAGSPVTHAVTPTQTITIGRSILGDIIALTQGSNGNWTGSVITLSGNTSPNVSNIIAYTDPRLNRVFAFVLADSLTYWGAADDGSFLAPLPASGQSGWTSITSHASLYTTSSNSVTLAGTDLSGNLVIYFQNGQFAASDPQNWSYRNLTTQDIQAGGQTFVPVAGGLTTFATTWGGQNIAYLDGLGNVYTVWWAPGQSLWHLDNLSEIAGAPAITGPLSPLTTPWNGLNVIGADAQGRLVTIWWAPDTTWQYAPFIDSTTIPNLDPASITTYVTPWNAMNIVGRSTSTGTTVAYWWVPGFVGWRADELLTPSRPTGVITTGHISGGMNGSSQVLFAREATTGHFTELFWLPGNTTWDVADLTELVA